MNQNFDIFNQAEMPSIELCTPNLDKIYAIGNLISDTKISLRYNAISEFSFNFPQSIDGNLTILSAYELIKTKKYLHIENIGYFIIQEVEEKDDGSIKIKQVKCESLESELKNKKVTDFKRTSVPIINSIVNVEYEYEPIYESSPSGSAIIGYTPVYYSGVGENPNNQVILYFENAFGIVDTILAQNAENWSIDTSKPVPTSLVTTGGAFDEFLVATIVRGFDISDSNVYNILTEEVEKAFGCAVIFNKEERSLYFEDMNSIEETNIFLSHDNLIKNAQIIEYSDEIATCLSCYGKSGISISYSNPLGNSKIYNFEYFKTTEWMSESLINLIDDWNIAINKEMIGTTTGSHLGEAWGTFTYLLTTYPDVRWLDFMKDACIRLGRYPIYTRQRREEERAGQMRLIRSVPYYDNISKYYKTNYDFLWSGRSIDSYPTSTSASFVGDTTETIYQTELTSASQVITTEIGTLSYPRQIGVSTVGYFATPISGSVTIYGTDTSGSPINETLIFSSSTTEETTINFKTVTQLDFPPYTTPGDTLVAYGDFEKLGTSITIPLEYRLKNAYRWSEYGGLQFITIALPAEFDNAIVTDSITNLAKLESGEKYSNFVETLFNAYSDIYTNDVGKTYLENLIAQQEILRATAIELKDNNKKDDHNTNIRFLKEFLYIYQYSSYAQIPSESNTSGYVLNNDTNKLDQQDLIDHYIYPGTTTDGKVVGDILLPVNCLGGLNQINGTISGLNYYITKLEYVMTVIKDALSLSTFFGSFYQSLLPFIIENTYQNEYAVIYSGEIKDKILTAIDLYNQGLDVLERTSSPRYEFSIDLANFINLYEYKDTFTKDLALGKKIRLNIKDSIVNTILLEIIYSFDDLTKIDMTFGNRLRLDDVRFQFTDFVGQIYQSSSNISFNRDDWYNFTSSYQDSVDVLISNPIEDVDNTSLTNLSSEDVSDTTYEVSVTKAGLLIRKKLDEENYFSKEILLTNGVIAYTNDNWTSASYINS